MRTVVLLCGPPGAGKTTAAHNSGLTVYDRDDERWASEQHFTRALAQVGDDPTAQAVVIRTGATTSARRKAALLTRATHLYLLDPGKDTCTHRVKERHRDNWKQELRGVVSWYARHDRIDGILDFPGWEAVMRAPTAARGYGSAHRRERDKWAEAIAVEPHRCTCTRPDCPHHHGQCPTLIADGDEWDLGHTDDRTGYVGPECIPCNRGAGARNANATRQVTIRGW